MFDKVLFRFLSVAIISGAALGVIAAQLLDTAGTGHLVAFALGVGVVALLFPKIVDPLPKDVVDFWYYILAIVAVVFFYVQDRDQRTKIERYFEYRKISDAKFVAEQKLTALEAIAESPQAIVRVLTQRSRSFASIEAALLRALCENREPYIPTPPRIPLDSGQTDTQRRIVEDPQMRQIAKVLACTDRREKRIEQKWTALANSLESGAFSRIRADDFADEPSMVGIGDARVSLFFALASVLVVLDSPDSQKFKEIEAELLSEKLEIQKDLEKNELQHAAVPPLAESKPGFVDIIVLYAWPYILVLALGFKIARVRYV